MSTASKLNPLSKLKNLTVKHLLIAFKYSTDAYNYKFDYNIGGVGTIVNDGCGQGIVVVNEMRDSLITIHAASTTWNFYSPTNSKSTSYNGSMEIIDRSSFYFNQILTDFTNKLDMSLTHLTFFWVTQFSGINANQSVEYYYSAPMFFHSINVIQDSSNILGNSYNIDFVNCYNTHGMSPQFSTVLQNSINHRDGNTSNTAPQTHNPSTGLKPLRAEDAAKLKPRTDKLNKTKYMKTVDDFAKAFEYALTNQTKPHKKQLQQFLNIIRNDYSQKVLNVRGKELPIIYHMKVDDYYKNKELNNRNLPFEQFEVDERINGLSTITFPLGISLQTAINEVMRMSKDIARDHKEFPVTTYKITTTTSKECDSKYHIYTKINKFISPYNSDTKNTGPGNNFVTEVLNFTYQDPTVPDPNLLALTYGANNNTETLSIEEVDDSDDIQAVYADREMQTSSREIDGVSFFKNAFSGLKLARGILHDNGLQNSEAASLLSNFNPTQPTAYILRTVGNPHLLSDINRNPLEVIDDSHSNPLIYKYCEYEPMYIKLRIYFGNNKSKDANKISDNGTYYYENYLHMYKIVNMYTSGEFVQLLYCGRTNERL